MKTRKKTLKEKIKQMDKGISVPVYWAPSGRKGVMVDEESIREEFEAKLKKIMKDIDVRY